MPRTFINLPNTWNPAFIRLKWVRWCFHTEQYIGSFKQRLFFPYLLRISLNIYSFPIFILYQCCSQIFNFVTYFLGVCIGGRVVMDIWSGIFAENSVSYLKFVSVRTGGRESAKCGRVWTGVDRGRGSKITKMCGLPL